MNKGILYLIGLLCCLPLFSSNEAIQLAHEQLQYGQTVGFNGSNPKQLAYLTSVDYNQLLPIVKDKNFFIQDYDFSQYPNQLAKLINALNINSLSGLVLMNTNINAKQCINILNALQNSVAIEKLFFIQNPIGNEGAKALAQFLQNKKTKWIKVKQSKIQKEGLITLIKTMKTLPSLEYIDLSYQNLLGSSTTSSYQSDGIAEAMTGNGGLIFKENLGYLSLAGLNLNAKDLSTIVKSVAQMRVEDHYNLHTLFLDGNLLLDSSTTTSEDYKALVKDLQNMISCNNTLKRLSISANRLQNSGAIKIAKSLPLNSALKKLNLKFCEIDEEGGQALLMSVNGLQEINLQYNRISRESIEKIKNSLKRNISLLQLTALQKDNFWPF